MVLGGSLVMVLGGGVVVVGSSVVRGEVVVGGF